MRGSENSTRKLLAWYREGEKMGHSKQPSQSTTRDEEYDKDGAPVEKFDEEHGINFLSEWSLPNIADRRSAMILLPVLR